MPLQCWLEQRVHTVLEEVLELLELLVMAELELLELPEEHIDEALQRNPRVFLPNECSLSEAICVWVAHAFLAFTSFADVTVIYWDKFILDVT